jgi:hypothetical protein
VLATVVSSAEGTISRKLDGMGPGIKKNWKIRNISNFQGADPFSRRGDGQLDGVIESSDGNGASPVRTVPYCIYVHPVPDKNIARIRNTPHST